jgi:hypothetical protein
MIVIQIFYFYTDINKIKDTKLERYGDAGYSNPKKTKNTIKEKYGVDHFLQLEQYIKKQKADIRLSWLHRQVRCQGLRVSAFCFLILTVY